MEKSSNAWSLTRSICMNIHHGGLGGGTEKSLAHFGEWTALKWNCVLTLPGRNSTNKPRGVWCFRHGCQDKDEEKKKDNAATSGGLAALVTVQRDRSQTGAPGLLLFSLFPPPFLFFKAWQQPAIDKSPVSGTRRMHSDAITEHFPHEGGCAGRCCVWGGVCKKKKKGGREKFQQLQSRAAVQRIN